MIKNDKILRNRIFRIVRTLAYKFGLSVLDFSEPYIFNCPPNIREDLYLNKIMVDDKSFSVEGVSMDGIAYTISESDIENKYLEEIIGWFSDEDTYEYIVNYFSN